MEAQVENAVEIAWNPTSEQTLKLQAFEFLNQLRADPSSWQVCLALFTREPKPLEIVRHFSLEIVNNAVQAQQLDTQSLGYVKDTLMNYVRHTYLPGSRPENVDTAHIQNKLTQTMTYLFTSLYASGWESFFDDFRVLTGDSASVGTTNVAATILYLRMLGSIHDEIADVLVSRPPDEQKRNTQLKDLIRVRDAQRISLSWQEILGKWRQTDLTIIEMCLKTICRWVSWVDISLVVNERLLNILFELAGQQGIAPADSGEGKVRDAAIDAFTETVGKKMKPTEKIELIVYLNLGDVVGRLIASPPLEELRSTSSYDTDLAETVAKLVNNTVFDIVKALDIDSTDTQTRNRADELLRIFITYLLRFFADEYDEICSTVIPSLTDLLTFFRKIVRSKKPLAHDYINMLPPILDAIITKMKYDETASWGDENEQTDEAEFQELRKRLHILQQTIAAIDETLCVDTLSRIVANTFRKLSSPNNNLTWRDIDLALHEMYLFGELASKSGGLYAKKDTSSVASSRLIEMMATMVQTDVASYPHPVIQLQYMEICVRYIAFFENNAHFIPRVLENFVRFTHADHIRVRSRSWYLFFRLVKPLKAHLGDVSQMVIQAIGDLLTIKAELPTDSADEDMSSEESDSDPDALFNSQLYLFEAIGCISSTSSIPVDRKILYAESVMNPLFADLSQNLEPAKNGDERAILQIHHIIMALGTLARGFSDWTPGSTSSSAGVPPPTEVSEGFVRASEAILVALESLRVSLNIRTAARFAFSRLLGVLGSRVLSQLPRWIDGLLSESSSNDEMATFLRLLDQVVFAFKAEILVILDSLLTPLLQRVFTGMAEPANGTDDQIQLAELRREYLNFLLAILNQDLASVIVSTANQSIFDNIITTIELFARDSSDYPTARLAVSVLIRMTAIWGGPDIGIPSSPVGSTFALPPSPALPGFDKFAITRFSPISWSIPGSPGFNPKDAQARQVLQEVAGLQLEILRKTGRIYLESLKEDLTGMGVSATDTEEYLRSLIGAGEKGFKQFFVQFVGKGMGS